jgi:uncharacterized membrane protein
MDTLRRYALAILFAAASFAAVGMVYPRLPEVIPAGFSWAGGGADRFLPKGEGAFLLPARSAMLVALLIALAPPASREPGSSLHRVYPQAVAAVAAFFLYHTLVLLAAAMGTPLDVHAYVIAGLGILLVFLGNSSGKLTRNLIIGIRTLWTLASDEVWFRTHRLGGWLLVLAGLLMCVAALMGEPRLGTLGLAAAVLVSVVYSWVISRRPGTGYGAGGARDRGG